MADWHDVESDERPAEAPEGDSSYRLGRLLAFSDGVFAIAITLLVLNVPVPGLRHPSADALRQALVATGGHVVTFAWSFGLVGLYWIFHHRLYARLRRVDGWLLWLNLLVLFTVCLIPFSAGVMGRYGDLVPAFEVYCGNLAALGVMFGALQIYAVRRGLGDPRPARGREEVWLPLIFPAFLIVMMLVALWSPLQPSTLWLACPAAWLLFRAGQLMRRRAAARR